MKKPDGGAAFPLEPNIPSLPTNYGMTLRDYFAASAMQGLIGKMSVADSKEKIAKASYILADAMIAERLK